MEYLDDRVIQDIFKRENACDDEIEKEMTQNHECNLTFLQLKEIIQDLHNKLYSDSLSQARPFMNH